MRAILSTLGSVLVFSTFFMLNLTRAEAQYSELQFKIERYTSVEGEIDIRSYIKNVEQYTEFRLVAIEVVAGALNDSAAMAVYVKGTQQGQTLQLGKIASNLVPIEQDLFMGQGAEEIKVRTRNPSYIKNVKLILTR